MPGYRLYVLDRFDGHILRSREFVAADDEAAKQVVAGLADGRPMELWCRSRIVGRWPGRPPGSSERQP